MLAFIVLALVYAAPPQTDSLSDTKPQAHLVRNVVQVNSVPFKEDPTIFYQYVTATANGGWTLPTPRSIVSSGTSALRSDGGFAFTGRNRHDEQSSQSRRYTELERWAMHGNQYLSGNSVGFIDHRPRSEDSLDENETDVAMQSTEQMHRFSQPSAETLATLRQVPTQRRTGCGAGCSVM